MSGRSGDGRPLVRGEDGPIKHERQLRRKEPTMDSQIRLMEINHHQQHLRDEAAGERLASGRQDRFGAPYPASRVPRTIGALRRLVGTSYA
jgi:hypothetical protein